MSDMKAFSDLEQSKKLAEILPLESADMFYTLIDQGLYLEVKQGIEPSKDDIPCWSLAALLGVLPNSTDICKNIEGRYYVHGFFSDNPVDACVDAIKALHELKLL